MKHSGWNVLMPYFRSALQPQASSAPNPLKASFSRFMAGLHLPFPLASEEWPESYQETTAWWLPFLGYILGGRNSLLGFLQDDWYSLVFANQLLCSLTYRWDLFQECIWKSLFIRKSNKSSFGHHAKSWLIGKDPDAGRDWGQKEKATTEDEMAGWHHRLDGHESE